MDLKHIMKQSRILNSSKDINHCNDDMQEIQKATCNSCGTTFVVENGVTLCLSCSANQSHHQHSCCGCGH